MNRQTDTNVVQAWQDVVQAEVRTRPWLASLLLQKGSLLFDRFVWFYGRLTAVGQRQHRRLALGVGTVALALALSQTPTPAHAATITVGPGCTLVQAIHSANTDTSVDSCTAGSGADTIVLAGNVYTYLTPNGTDAALPDITSEITIEGNGALIERDVASVDEFRLITITNSGNLTLNQALITGGSLPAGNGGGILNDGGSLSLVNQTAISENTSYRGAGIHNNGGTVRLQDSFIAFNEAGYSGAGINNTGGTVILNQSSLFANIAARVGGGIANYANGSVTLNQSFIANNGAYSFYYNAGDGVWVTRGDGGGIANIVGNVTGNAVFLYSNSAGQSGGGIFNNGSVELHESIITGNGAVNNNGGGMLNTGSGTAVINNSQMSGNYTYLGSGGGIYNEGTLTLNKNSLNQNDAYYDGGGIANNGTLTLNQSTLSGNYANRGGGLFNNATATLNNVTISQNVAYDYDFGGGGISQNNGTLTLHRTIVSGNSAPVTQEINPHAGTINAGSHNILGHAGLDNTSAFDDASWIDTTDVNATTDGTNTPLTSILNPILDDNGGPTLTHALVTGSPAIDIAPNGSAGTTDQRGAARDFDANTGDGNTTHLNDAGAVEFREKITEGDCGLEAIAVENTFTFASGNTVTINVIDPAGLTCISVEEMGTNHPMATGSAGNHGIHTGNWWHISGDVDSGFEVEITLPFAGADDDSRVCKWPGGNGGAGWDCGDETVNSGGGGVVTRTGVDSFSDWAVGDTVNPTAVTNLQADVTPAAEQGWLVGLLVGLLGATTAVFLSLRRYS